MKEADPDVQYRYVLATRTAEAVHRLLGELSHMGADCPDVRQLVVTRMVSIAAEACARVQGLGVSDPAAIKAIAATQVRWPVNYSLLPHDVESFDVHLSNLGLAKSFPLNLKRWKLWAVGTRWAFAFWQLVDRCKWHKERGLDLAGGEWLPLIDGREVLRADFVEVVELPPLSRDPIVLKQWKATFGAHLDRHYPGEAVLMLTEWQKHLAGRGKDTVTEFRDQILKDVGAGLRSIARPQ